MSTEAPKQSWVCVMRVAACPVPVSVQQRGLVWVARAAWADGRHGYAESEGTSSQEAEDKALRQAGWSPA